MRRSDGEHLVLHTANPARSCKRYYTVDPRWALGKVDFVLVEAVRGAEKLQGFSFFVWSCTDWTVKNLLLESN